MAVIHTDGSCFPNPGPGGWAAVVEFAGVRSELSGRALERTTNNRMELTAAIQGLLFLREPCDVLLVTDSQYLITGATQWVPNWKRWNWTQKSKGGRDGRIEVINADLWREIDRLAGFHKITWKWERGHAGCKENNRCDKLAELARKQ